MERLGDDVRRELGRFGPTDGAGMADVVEAWPAAVGAEVSRNAWPARVARDGTLHVATSSSAWAFELGHLAADVLGRLREALGDGAPNALRFAPGRLPDLSVAPARERVETSPEDEERGAALASPIADDELRELVARAAAASLARARSGRRF